jgi:hypothetical protein
MASTYECQACTCSAETSNFSTGFYDGKVEPIGEDHDEPGGTQNYRAMQRDVNCFGGPGPWFLAPISAQWSTGDPSIATVNAAGTVTAQDPGTTSVWATWSASTHQWNPNNEYCDTYSGNVSYSASFTTVPPVPHHLEVIDDTTFVVAGCSTGSFLRRELLYRVVNKNNRSCGSVPMSESFPGQTVASSCISPPGNVVSPTTCFNIGFDGTFVDRLQAGCDHIITDQNCGFNVDPLRWEWCPTGGPVKTVATLFHFVHRNRIAVNGFTFWPPGTYFFP